MKNPAIEAMRRNISGKVSADNPAIEAIEPKTISIEVRPTRGALVYATARFAYADWITWTPIKRVLAIHDQCRGVLHGMPFEVIRESLSA